MMATSIPVDVVRGIRQIADDMKAKAEGWRTEARELQIKADLLEQEGHKLAAKLESWKSCFPDTVE